MDVTKYLPFKKKAAMLIEDNELCERSQRTGGKPERLVWEKINDGG